MGNERLKNTLKNLILAKSMKPHADTKESRRNNKRRGFAETGSGPIRFLVVPSIRQMNGSYVVTDLSGAIYKDTADLLKENGYTVRTLNFICPALSDSYNPFLYVNTRDETARVAEAFFRYTWEFDQPEQGEGAAGAVARNQAERDLFMAIALYEKQ